jgi:hypothetical protein
MYVCMYICMYVCMYICMYVSMYVCMYAGNDFKRRCFIGGHHVRCHQRLLTQLSLFLHTYIHYVCTVCMYVLYVYMYVCMYVCIRVHSGGTCGGYWRLACGIESGFVMVRKQVRTYTHTYIQFSI